MIQSIEDQTVGQEAVGARHASGRPLTHEEIHYLNSRQFDLSDKWPWIEGVMWFDGICIPVARWKKLTQAQRDQVVEFLAKKGRVIREQTQGTGRGMIHLPKMRKAEVSELTSDSIHICVSSEFVRHYDIVSVRIDNAYSRKAAVQIFREWLQDMTQAGLNEHSMHELARG